LFLEAANSSCFDQKSPKTFKNESVNFLLVKKETRVIEPEKFLRQVPKFWSNSGKAWKLTPIEMETELNKVVKRLLIVRGES
jgi:hypothetical protein